MKNNKLLENKIRELETLCYGYIGLLEDAFGPNGYAEFVREENKKIKEIIERWPQKHFPS